MSNRVHEFTAYPTLGSRIRRRLLDIPGRLADAQDALLPGEFARFYRRVAPYTMSNKRRLRGLYGAVNHVLAHDIPGDIVECGTARGGSAALMGLTLQARGSHRKLWVFDTFEGLPPPTQDDPDYEFASQFTGQLRAGLEEVQSLFDACGLLEQTVFVKGLFQETLPVTPIERIAVLHIDGDWYESVKVCLETLYDRVSPGGIIQLDDYGDWAGAKKAVDEFLAARCPGERLHYLDRTGRQLVKP
ncbi:MAG TPA: TylF/MycF/NovP-related O-methyltransferase [Chthonomonadaceae bacterium]|nr:TylF/MycF/NovP-related O-methyltransferase [Chthonomonadaceae bacterium]